MRLPELLAPAGNREQLEAALLYGADAVYLGGGELSLRAARGFRDDGLEGALQLCRTHGVRLYYCLNAFPRQEQLGCVAARLERLATLGVDGCIVADPGVLRLARRLCPELPVHMSTQANTCNAEAAAFWQEQGACRVNLARELPSREIRAVVRACPGLETECFVHGALCLALSGQCLLSAWLNDRPANLGQCTQPCRYEYRPLMPAEDGRAAEAALGRPISLVVEEATRPGEALWEATREGGYGALWAPEDVCLIRYAAWFVRVGVSALKIEGRMRTGGYVAHAVDAYRTALNDLAAGAFRPESYMGELRRASLRPMGTGFFLPRRRPAGGPAARTPLLARLEEPAGDDAWRISVRGRWEAEKPVELLLPGLRRPVLEPGKYALENHRGERVGTLHPGMRGLLRCPTPLAVRGIYVRGVESL